MRLRRGPAGHRAPWAAVLLALSLTACARSPVVVPVAPTQRSFAPAVRRAVQSANEGGAGQMWSIVDVIELAGWTVEHYQLGSGPTLLLLHDASSPAVTVQAWSPGGWAHSPLDRVGGWSAGWPPRPIPRPTQSWRGTARDISGAAWTVAEDDGPQLVRRVMSSWPSAQPGPQRSPSEDLRLRLRRTYWQAVAGPPQSDAAELRQHPSRAVWVIAGAFDRGHMLTAARAALAGPAQPPSPPLVQARPGPGPRAPLQVAAPADAGAALIAWAWADPTPSTMARLEGLAQLLAAGPQARLSALTRDDLALGAEVHVEAGPFGASLEAFVNLGATRSATVAAAKVRDALSAIGEGRTTGLEIERMQLALQSKQLSRWSGLESRAQAAAEALILYQDLSALPESWAAIESIEEPALRALAQSLASTPPVVVRTRAP